MAQRESPAPAFEQLGLEARLVGAVAGLGYEEPTPIQRAAIPALLAGNDLLGQAATGTGKTAAFALPLLQRIASRGAGRATGGLVLVPTRELAMQVAEAVYRYGKDSGTRVLPIYGGQPIERQLRGLKQPVDVVVATPGRALDHLRRGTLRLDGVHTVVLDEADEMLDMGFAEDIEALLEATPADRQTALFSATFPRRLSAMAAKHLRNPVRIEIAHEPVTKGTRAKVRHVAYIVPRAHKVDALGRIFDFERPSLALVFCRTRTEVDALTETLLSRGMRAEALHGGLSQQQRDRVMQRFRSGASDLLVATDVAARGLDIENLSHVVNYDVPSAPEAYVHRTGRTGRAGREGVAITLAEPREHRLLKNIGDLLKAKIDVATLPTVADLRARRLELTAAGVRELLESDDLDRFRRLAEALASGTDVIDVAAAALKLAHVASGRERVEDEKDIPTLPPPSQEPRPPRKRPPKTGARRWATTQLWVGLGRAAGVRPADLVGAIANETGVDAKAIGAIQISDQYSLVEVPEEIADELIARLKRTFLKGKKMRVKREGERS